MGGLFVMKFSPPHAKRRLKIDHTPEQISTLSSAQIKTVKLDRLGTWVAMISPGGFWEVAGDLILRIRHFISGLTDHGADRLTIDDVELLSDTESVMILQMGWANLPRDERLAKNVRCISRTETKERQSMGDSHHTSSKTDVFGAYN